MTQSEIQAEIITQAQSLGVPASIALAVARRESSFNPNAIGSKGEIGLFQLMPATANMLGVDAYNINENILGGVSLLSIEYNRFGSWDKALAAYNAGSPAVISGKIPASTRAYVQDVLAMSSYGVSETWSEPQLATSAIFQLETIPTFTIDVWAKKYFPWAVVIIGGVLLTDYIID